MFKSFFLSLVLVLFPFDNVVILFDPGSGTVFDDSVSHLDFESSGSLCNDVDGAASLSVDGGPTQNTTSPPEGTGWIESTGTGGTSGGCNGTWSGAPWNSTSQDFSVSLVYEIDTLTGGTDFLFEMGSGPTGFKAFINNTDDVTVRGGNVGTIIDSAYSFGTRVAICVTFEDLATDEWNVYVGTGTSADFTWTGNHTADNDYNVLTNISLGAPLDGRIDAFRVWNRTLSGSECEEANAGA